MDRVTPERIAHVARLARLGLADEERQLFADQLGSVLGHAESLARLATGGVAPLRGDSLPRESLRDDEPRDGLSRDAALASAPDAADGLFRVPRILP